MSPLATTYTGASWEAIRSAMLHAADDVNGRLTVTGVSYPRISRAAGLAILQTFKRLRRAWKVGAGPYWPSLWYHLLGWYQEGDKFRLTTSHAMGAAAPELVAAVWEYVDDSAQELERARALPLLAVLDLSYAAYEATAREVYKELQAERARAQRKVPVPLPLPIPPGDWPEVDLDPRPGIRPPPEGKPTKSGGGGAGILLVLLLLLVARKKRR